MCVKSKRYKHVHVPKFTLNGRSLRQVSEEKYLGCIMSDDFSDDLDLSRQMRAIYTRGNMLIKNFKSCSDDVKLQLFKTYCSNLYCGQLWSTYKVF